MTSLKDSQPHLDPSLSIKKRLSDLLDRMTLEEKIGQLAGSYVGTLSEGHHSVDDVISEVDEYFIGSVAPSGWGGSPNESLEDAVDYRRCLEPAVQTTFTDRFDDHS